MMFPDLPAMAAAANRALPTEVPPTVPTRQPIAVVDGVAITPAARGEEQVAAPSPAEDPETSGCARAQTQIDDDSARALEAAERELRDGDPEGAQSRVTRALKKNSCPAAKLALLRVRAHTQAALGDLHSAATTIAEASELNVASASVDSLTSELEKLKVAAAAKEKGNGDFRKGDFEQACEHYTHALQNIPHCAALQCNLSAALVKVGRADEAVSAALRAIEIHGEYSKAKRRHADALMAAGRYDDAAQQYTKLRVLYPKDSDLKFQQAEALKRAKTQN